MWTAKDYERPVGSARSDLMIERILARSAERKGIAESRRSLGITFARYMGGQIRREDIMAQGQVL